MDINQIIDIVKNIPAEQWSNDQTIKQVIQTAAKKSGRTYTDDEINQYVERFRQFAGNGSALALIPMLIKKGISKGQLDDIIKKMN